VREVPACIERASVLSAHGLPVFIQQTLCELSLSHPFCLRNAYRLCVVDFCFTHLWDICEIIHNFIILMLASFLRHLVAKTLINVFTVISVKYALLPS